MKNEEIFFVILLGIAFLASFAYFTGKVISGPGDIGECGDIADEGLYNLTNSINASGTCFVASGDNVILDCNYLVIMGDGTGSGVEILGTNVTVRNCMFANFTNGILGNESSSEGVLEDNTLTLNYNGINLFSTTDYEITGNNVFENEFSGVYDKSSTNTKIIDNVLYDNNDSGVYLTNTEGLEIFDSNISKNKWGLTILSSVNTVILNNYFYNSFNAYDDTLDETTWNLENATNETNILGGIGKGGNYWNDYAGEDTDDDGIGDTELPYDSYGDIANGGDGMPLTGVAEPVEEGPTTYTPTDLELSAGYVQAMEVEDEVEFYVTWEPHYVTLDAFSSEEGNESVTITIASSPGTYNLTINETLTIDANFDGTDDLNISFIGFDGGLPELLITLLDQPAAPEPEVNETAEPEPEPTPTPTPTPEPEPDYDPGLPDYIPEEDEGGGAGTIVLVIIVLLLLGGGGFAAWYFLLRKKPEGEEGVEQVAPPESPAAQPPAQPQYQ